MDLHVFTYSNLVKTMLNCRIFTSPKFGEIRITKDDAGHNLFVAKDVAFVMFGTRGPKVLPECCKHLVQVSHPQIKNRKIFAIDLPDVSRLIAKSKKSYKIEFHDWIYDEVLPKLGSTSSDENGAKQTEETKEQEETTGQEQVRNNEEMSEAELILKLAKMNLSNEKRIVALEKQVEEALDRFTFSKDIDQYYSTIAGYIQRFNLPILVNQYASYGSRAHDICKRRGVKISKISDVRYGTINLYPNYILQELFKDYFNK